MKTNFQRRIKQCFFAFFLAGFLTPVTAHAQQFTPTVKQFIAVNVDTLALIHAKVVDGTGGLSKTDQTIIIIKGRIVQLGNASRITAPPSAKIIDCTGKTIIPGMIMMHEHLFYGESLPPNYLGLEMPISFPRLYLAGGATTIRTTGSTEPQTDLNIKKAIDKGQMPGPDIDVTGPYIEREFLPIPEVQFIKSPEEAAEEVSYWIARGCTSF